MDSKSKHMDKEIYKSGFWVQLKRYGNPKEAMGLYLDSFSGSRKIEVISGGPRLIAVVSAIPGVEHIVMHDIFEKPLEATREYMEDPQRFISRYPQLEAERDFLIEKGLEPNFGLVSTFTNDEMPTLRNFDGAMAEEVALHPPSDNPDEHLLPILLGETRSSLKKGGRFIFSMYPESRQDENSLLNHFSRLAGFVKMKKEDFYDKGWVHIDEIAKGLKKRANAVFEDEKEKFWLEDLSMIRMYSEKEVSALAKDGFRIIEQRNIPGGMFPFAARLYYVLEKM